MYNGGSTLRPARQKRVRLWYVVLIAHRQNLKLSFGSSSSLQDALASLSHGSDVSTHFLSPAFCLSPPFHGGPRSFSLEHPPLAEAALTPARLLVLLHDGIRT